MRLREWLDVHRELLELIEETGSSGSWPRSAGQWRKNRKLPGAGGRQPPAANSPRLASHTKYDSIHRAILAGLLSSIAMRGEGHDYNVAGGGKANLWPGSGMFRSKAKWIVAAEQVETTRRYLRCCGRIDPALDRAAGRAPDQADLQRPALGEQVGLGRGPGAADAFRAGDRRRASRCVTGRSTPTPRGNS